MADLPTIKRFTVAFEGDPRVGGNPFHIETPWGKPRAVSCDDEFWRAQVMEEALERIARGEHLTAAGLAEIADHALDLVNTPA